MSEGTEHKEKEPKQKKQQKKQKQSQQSKESGSGKLGSEESGKHHIPAFSKVKLALFDHLPFRSIDRLPLVKSDINIHPTIVKLGSLYQTGCIQDDDDRSYALLVAIHNVIIDYTTPPNKSLSWDLDKHVKNQVGKQCMLKRLPKSKDGV